MSSSPSNDLQGHWQEIASKWAHVGPPLRPSEQDIQGFVQIIEQWEKPRALILGVTPELYRLPWPEGTEILAVDHTQNMIDTVWPGPKDAVLCADWTNLPLQSDSRDIALCDGGFHLVSHPIGQTKFVESMRSVLAVGGVCGIRLFVPPETHESPDAVLEDLLAGRIANLNILKLRLGMAMQKTAAEGVRLGDVWDAIHSAGPDFEELAAKISWPIEHLKAINTYRNSVARYCFVTPDEVEQLFCETVGGFVLDSVFKPTYELGERCPIVVYRRVD
jgi:SAM-dependent methyltransferase